MSLSTLRSIISIHAPRAGSDLRSLRSISICFYFNPRSPCGERPHEQPGKSVSFGYFNPRSPCGERRSTTCRESSVFWISIHAPRAGSDVELQVIVEVPAISIHAPRAGSDTILSQRAEKASYFNPRSPCGERPAEGAVRVIDRHFNPRSPCGERQQRYTFFHAHLWREQTNTLMGLGYHCVCNTMKEAYFDFLPQKSGANLPGNPAYLGFAAKSSTYLPVDRWFYSQSVPLSSHTDFPDNKSEGCLFRDP